MADNVIWPAYFDAEKTRSEGRRVPRELAVTDPSVDEIAAAVQQVGYDVRIERSVTYPREHEPRGRVIARDVEDTKNDLIQAVAAYVTALRD